MLSTNAQAWNYLGAAYHYAGKPGDAERAYQRAVFLDHDLIEVHYNLGFLYLEENRPTAARPEFMTFTLHRANALEGLLMLGLAQLRCHEPVAAEKTFTEALRVSPQNPDALNGLAIAHCQRGKAADALNSFNALFKSRPSYSPALLNSAIVSQAYLKDTNAALAKYRQYVALKPAPSDTPAVKLQMQEIEAEERAAAANAAPAQPARVTNSPPQPRTGGAAKKPLR